jgi:hypothetical protein
MNEIQKKIKQHKQKTKQAKKQKTIKIKSQNKSNQTINNV